MEGLVLHRGANLIGRQDLRELQTPEPTDTHVPIPHHTLVENVIQSLAYRKLEVTRDEYAVTPDGMRLFGFIQVNIEHAGVQLALGLRNSHDKSVSLGMVAGYRVFVCDNLAFAASFAAITRKKHTKNLDLVETVGIGVDRVQRHFDTVRAQVDTWRGFELSDARAKSVIYDAFIGRGLKDAPQHIAKRVHKAYFEPQLEDFKPRTMWSLSNAFTDAFKELEDVKRMEVTACLPPFLEQYR